MQRLVRVGAGAGAEARKANVTGCGCQALRPHTTKPATARPSTPRKRKCNTTYVELLEVNNEKMTETQTPVSKFKTKYLTKFIANPQVSLGQLHKLSSLPKNKLNEKKSTSDTVVDKELLQDIENKILGKYVKSENTSLKEDDCAVIFTTEQITNINKLFEDPEKVKLIKDSYDKFRRDTLWSQKMKDLIFAIDEGVNQSANLRSNVYKNIKEHNSNSFKLDNTLVDISSKNSSEVLQYLENSSYKSTNLPSFADVLEEEFRDTECTLNEEADFPIINEINEADKTMSSSLKASPSVAKKSKKKKNLESAQEKQNVAEKLLLNKEKILKTLLITHFSVCISIGSIEKAHKILIYYRNRGKRYSHHPKIKDVDIFNIILLGYAKQGDYNSLNSILKIMSEDNIDLNIHSYSAIFQCIERSQQENKSSLLFDYFKNMVDRGFQLNDLVTKCSFLYDEREVLLRAIKIVDSDFVYIHSNVDVDYNCNLLKSLNPDGDKHGVYNKTNKITSPADGVITMEKLLQNIQKQLECEKLGTTEVQNIVDKGTPSEFVLYCRQKLKESESEWRDSIHKALLRNISTLKSQSNVSPNALNIHPYMIALPIEEYINILINQIMKIADGSETYSQSNSSLQCELGAKVFNRFYIKTIKENGTLDKLLHNYHQYCDWYMNKDVNIESDIMNSRQKWQNLLSSNIDGVSLDLSPVIWPLSACSSIGKFLHNILINDVKINIYVFQRNSKKKKYLPILYNVFRGKGKFVRQEMKPHPLLSRLVRESLVPTLNMDSSLTPCICPPLPWSDVMHGGYLITKTPVMRLPNFISQPMDLLKETTPQNLYPALDSLNQLGSIPWTVNKPVLDILLQVFRSGGSRVLGVARPASAIPQPPPASSSLSKRERATAIRQRAGVARIRQELHSLWCDSLYKFSLANHYRDEVFWLPHNMDFRGRVYPCPPHLSHLGADTSRALLVFARGQPLGPRGLSWLKLHCINLTGTMKKCTVHERLAHADTIIDDILDSADNPLNGKQWWVSSDEPWQTLACCMEIAKAIRSPNPEEYICHFPIHQDGSCNGLQHYAALGGDSAGAFSVNLSPAERPQDVYSSVVALVEKSRASDAELGIEVAKLLEGFVGRKVIKQTVMTTVYGVTKFGARLQIAKQLKDMDKFPKKYVWLASHYLTNKTFESIREMFTSTKNIQDWLTDCAKLISGACNSKVEWITPLGLPIVQPYYKPVGSQSNYYSGNPDMNSVHQYDKPCIMKQKNAFPPNFIHSLDSSHMMLTSLYCEASNITFVSVHDCFWTHPSTVEIMNKICRDQFVALHSQPILEILSNDLLSKFSYVVDVKKKGSVKDISEQKLNMLLKHLPQKGDFDLQNVLKSIYFFS